MGGRKKNTLEEEIAAMVRAEFAGTIAQLEEDLQEHRRRSELKEEARRALEDAEAEARKLHSERTAIRERFWAAYYGEEGEVPFSEVEEEPRALGRAISKAEGALRRARADFEAADFDGAAEGAELRERAKATVGEADRRIGELQEALGGLLTEVWRDIKEAGKAQRDEIEDPRTGAAEGPGAGEGAAEPRPWWRRPSGV